MNTLGVWTDREGHVTEVLLNTLSLPLQPGTSFRDVIDPLSRQKFGDLLRAARTQGAVVDWELNLLTQDGPLRVRTAAGKGPHDRLLILVSSHDSDTHSVLEELIRVNNEQTNALREAHKALGQRPRPATVAPARPSLPDETLSEYASLSNESINAQRHLAQRTGELTRLNKIKNELLGMAAHDLRNPLMTITGFADLLRIGACGAVNDTQREYLDSIVRSAAFMGQLIEDLLQHAQVETGTLTLSLQPTDLGALLQDVVGTYRVQAEAKQIEVRLTIQDGVSSLILDRHKIEQVLVNLISNAIKFSLPETVVEVRLRPRGGGARIEVEDHGPGISLADQQRLFEPFVRASAKPTGGEISTGLGLAIVKSIVKGHGGQLWVESEVGAGSTFVVELSSTTDPDAS